MPLRVFDLLASWKGRFGRNQFGDMGAQSHCASCGFFGRRGITEHLKVLNVHR
jgi:hypothetical protein